LANWPDLQLFALQAVKRPRVLLAQASVPVPVQVLAQEQVVVLE